MPKRKTWSSWAPDRRNQTSDNQKVTLWKRPEDSFQETRIWKRPLARIKSGFETDEDAADICSQSSAEYDSHSSRQRLDNFERRESISELEDTPPFADDQEELSNVTIEPINSQEVPSSSESLRDEDEGDVAERLSIAEQRSPDDRTTSPDISDMPSSCAESQKAESMSFGVSCMSTRSPVLRETIGPGSAVLSSSSSLVSQPDRDDVDIVSISETFDSDEDRAPRTVPRMVSSPCPTEDRDAEFISSLDSENHVAAVGVRGTEWLQALTLSRPDLALTTSPSKKDSGGRDAVDMIRKVTKVKGGLLEQLEGVLANHRESKRLHRGHVTDRVAAILKVRLLNFQFHGPFLVGHCERTVQESEAGLDLPPSSCKLGVVLPVETAQKWSLQEGNILHLAQPWQTVYVDSLQRWFFLGPNVVDAEPRTVPLPSS